MAHVKLSHPEKVLFPADGITKADLADYYAAVAPAMVRHTRERPMNLWRWNAGIEKDVVVQQAIPKGAPAWVARVEVQRRRGGAIEHVVANDADTLRWIAQINCITPHVWTSRVDRLDRPDRMIFDFDPPDEGADFDHIREGALAMGELLRELGREPYAMTSGSRGIHVLAPLRRTEVHDVVREQAREIGEELAVAPPRPADHRVAQEQARGPDPHRHRAQHLRPDDGRAVLGPRQARRAGRDPAAVGGARGPGAARGQPHARDSAGAPGPRRRPVEGRSGGAKIPAVFWRRRARTEVAATQDLGVRVLSITRDDEPAPPPADAAWGELHRIVAEAVIWQDKAEELLVDISHREPLAELAPRGGPLIRRFCELRRRLPESDDPELRRITAVLGPVFDHHALMLSSSLDMLAVDWRSERIVEELERITGLGAPAQRLDSIREELVDQRLVDELV